MLLSCAQAGREYALRTPCTPRGAPWLHSKRTQWYAAAPENVNHRAFATHISDTLSHTRAQDEISYSS